jgi:hypothetical protein
MAAAFLTDAFFETLLGQHPDPDGLEKMIRQAPVLDVKGFYDI